MKGNNKTHEVSSLVNQTAVKVICMRLAEIRQDKLTANMHSYETVGTKQILHRWNS